MLGLVRVSGGAMGAFWVMNSLREVGRALDPQTLPQFGLVAEQGAKVDPELRSTTTGSSGRRDNMDGPCLGEFRQSNPWACNVADDNALQSDGR